MISPHKFDINIIIPFPSNSNPFFSNASVLTFYRKTRIVFLERSVMYLEITVGMKGLAESCVDREDTAAEVGSGSLLVYATPCMVALMEGAACDAIRQALTEEQTSVGTELNIKHISATPVGLEVRAEAEVTAVEGRIITFEVKAYDESGLIGEGTHKRAVINAQKFLDKTYAKL
jgi:predicted thioesterase